MRQVPGWPILAVVTVMITVIAVTVFKTPEFDNVIAWMFLGGALLLIGEWTTLVIQAHSRSREIELRKVEDDD